MENTVTNDLTQFGYRELALAADLLKVYAENGKPNFLSDGVSVWFNKNSGNVFLSDENYNVGVLEGLRVVQFYSCGQCGYEGTQEDAIDDSHNFEANDGYCSKECKDKNN